MIPTHRVPTHPGEVLREELLAVPGMTQTQLADLTGMTVQRINELIHGKRGITPDTAWRLARAFRTSPESWMNLQVGYGLARARPAA